MSTTRTRPPSVRRRLIVKYTALSASLVAGFTLLYLLTREKTTAYRPGEAVAGITNELERRLPEGYPRVQFADVSRQAGIDFVHFPGRRSTQLPEDMGSGVAWGDYDGDGDDDLFLANIAGPLTASAAEIAASPGTNELYRNNGDGTFTDVTAAAGLGHHGVGMAAAWADFNNDSRLDLVVTTFGRILLYRGHGDGTFEEIARDAGLLQHERYWSGASWGDYDRDGDLDLYVCAYVKYEFRAADAGRKSQQFASDVPYTLNPSSYSPEPNALFRNNGNGTFTEVAERAGVANPAGRSLNAAWCDFDRDGWLDLYIANDVSDNAMYRNLGNGRFEDVSHSALVSDYRGAMGLAVGDYDDDSDPDIFITHWMAQENGLFWNMLRSFDGKQPPGELRFMDVADMVGLGQIALDRIGWATSFFDFDNDGRLDLFATNGSTFQDEADPSRLKPMVNFLFWQKSPEEGFFDLGEAAGPAFAAPQVGRGGAYADYDNDGDLDLALVRFGDAPYLLRNDGGNANHWLKVRLKRAKGAGEAVGAVVELTSAGRTRTRFAGCQPSYLSQNTAEIHFGLGSETVADTLRVQFLSGVTRELSGVAANQTVVVGE